MPSPHHRDPNEIPSALPADYTRVHNYADWEGAHPGVPPPGMYLNADFDAVEQSIAETQDRAALIQRDDGNLQNGIVTLDSLDPALAADLAALVSNEVADLIVALDAQVAAAAASALAAATAETNAELAETNAEAAQTAAEAAQTAAELAETNAEAAQAAAEAAAAALGAFSVVQAELSLTGQNVSTAGGGGLVFDTEVLDTGGEYNPATGSFTAANAGYYQVHADAVAYRSFFSTAATFQVSIVTGAPTVLIPGVPGLSGPTASMTYLSSTVSGIVHLNAGQAVGILATYVDSSPGTALVYPAHLSIHRVK